MHRKYYQKLNSSLTGCLIILSWYTSHSLNLLLLWLPSNFTFLSHGQRQNLSVCSIELVRLEMFQWQLNATVLNNRLINLNVPASNLIQAVEMLNLKLNRVDYALCILHPLYIQRVMKDWTAGKRMQKVWSNCRQWVQATQSCQPGFAVNGRWGSIEVIVLNKSSSTTI